jgi:hypothetical protein
MYEMKVYLAGKIEKNDWRHELVPNLRGLEIGRLVHCGPFIYCGPYFLACDHGCAHGFNTHGLQPNRCMPGELPPRWTVPSVCCQWLRRANLLFAWIENHTCHGTLTEIGWAHMLGIPVFMAFSSRDLCEQMWFPAGGPRTVANVFSSPKDALLTAIRSWPALRDSYISGCNLHK